jgi:hypothetical protein
MFGDNVPGAIATPSLLRHNRRGRELGTWRIEGRIS